MTYTVDDLFKAGSNKDKFTAIFNYFIYETTDTPLNAFDFLLKKICADDKYSIVFVSNYIILNNCYDILSRMYDNNIYIHEYEDLNFVYSLLFYDNLPMLKLIVSNGFIFSDISQHRCVCGINSYQK